MTIKKASVVSIGNELLSGRTTDTNSSYICSRLLEYSIPVVSIYVTSDDVHAILKCLEAAVVEADFVLITGGLGPTDDDLTRNAIAQFMDTDLQCRQDLLAELQAFFNSLGRPMADTNRVQAFLPAGTEPIKNSIGTAPGIFAEKQGKLIFAMPGVPAEMKAMLESFVLDKLKSVSGSQAVCIKKLQCFGTGESNIAQLLGNLMQRGRNPLINCTAGKGVITLHIIATAEYHQKAAAMVEADVSLIKKCLGEYVYGDDDETLADAVAKKLTSGQYTLSVAESCTGGNIAKQLTDIPGASQFLTYGWITYSNVAKITELGVPKELIERYGAVSEPVARAMAEGALKKSGSDYAVSTTGIAGPGGGTDEKPVGTVYIAIASQQKCTVKKVFFPRQREVVRSRATNAALDLLRKLL